MVEGNPDTPPAQERVFLLDREIGQRLVAANIQRTHGNGARREGFELLPVILTLLLL